MNPEHRLFLPIGLALPGLAVLPSDVEMDPETPDAHRPESTGEPLADLVGCSTRQERRRGRGAAKRKLFRV